MGSSRLGILGGTFDPVHNGHLDLARAAVAELALSELLFIPAPMPPHKNGVKITDFTHRYRMVQLAIKGCAQFAASDMENRREGKSYTYDTLTILKEQMPERELYFLTGADALQGFMNWYRWQDILDLCTVVVTTRPGFAFAAPPELLHEAARRQGGLLLLDKEAVDISATALREAIASGTGWQQQLPAAVAQYIIANNLYRG